MSKKVLGKDLDKLGFEGFEDVIDLIEPAIEKRKKKIGSESDNFELFNFLENELSRMKKVDRLLSKQIDNLQENPQVDGLLKIQKEKNLKIKRELAEKFASKNSPVHKNLEFLFETLFHSNIKPKE